jgi:hypothetical protein
MRSSFLFSLFMSSLLAQSASAVVNGIEAKDSDFPAVVRLQGPGEINDVCSGTFLSENTILTAAHCLILGFSSYQGLKPKLSIRSSKYHHVGDDDTDLALLIFDKEVAPAILPLQTNAPALREKFTVVGFGCSDFNNARNTRGLKRFGENEILIIQPDYSLPSATMFFSNEDGALSIDEIRIRVESGEKLERKAEACVGDSGGPAIIGGKVFGIVSSVGGGSQYASTTSLFAQEFFRQAVQAGAKIPNIKGSARTDFITVSEK